ncbi:MAG TPA: alpha/beta hydrolase [Acidimicrobiales bacterium]|nr:alpha/beta hydrolase [Acidimicrobiales bacterium]
MALDEQAQGWLKAMEELGAPPLNEMGVDAARQVYRDVVQQFGIPPEEVANVRDTTIAGPQGEIPVRIYTPAGSGPFPVLVYFHGGGWVIGDLEVVHGACSVLANRSHAVVVSVDYRLAPEHPFPAAVEDCWAATTWVGANAGSIKGEGDRLAVGGDSAGGTLAAVVSAMARDNGGPPIMHQLLLYPAMAPHGGTPSSRENGEGYFLTTELMDWF